eukprot:scaffold5064_cov115-Isochrysis_galbana.AAC.12
MHRWLHPSSADSPVPVRTNRASQSESKSRQSERARRRHVSRRAGRDACGARPLPSTSTQSLTSLQSTALQLTPYSLTLIRVRVSSPA